MAGGSVMCCDWGMFSCQNNIELHSFPAIQDWTGWNKLNSSFSLSCYILMNILSSFLFKKHQKKSFRISDYSFEVYLYKLIFALYFFPTLVPSHSPHWAVTPPRETHRELSPALSRTSADKGARKNAERLGCCVVFSREMEALFHIGVNTHA